jgi:hypothetical protein
VLLLSRISDNDQFRSIAMGLALNQQGASLLAKAIVNGLNERVSIT